LRKLRSRKNKNGFEIFEIKQMAQILVKDAILSSIQDFFPNFKILIFFLNPEISLKKGQKFI
jgi:hypothetical protein